MSSDTLTQAKKQGIEKEEEEEEESDQEAKVRNLVVFIVYATHLLRLSLSLIGVDNQFR